MTRVVNIYDGVPYDVYCGRPGKGHEGPLGNPLGHLKTRGAAIEAFRVWFLDKVTNDAEYRALVLACKDKVLGCFCKPRACHCDVIAAWLNGEEVIPGRRCG